MAETPLHAAHDHIIPPRVYVLNLLALLALMAATVAIAEKVQFPAFWIFSGTFLNSAAAMTIACIKAFLVIMFFMHIKWSTNLTKLYAIAGFVWLSLLFITLGDYMTRQYEPAPGWTGKQESALPRVIGAHDHLPNDANEANLRPRQ